MYNKCRCNDAIGVVIYYEESSVWLYIMKRLVFLYGIMISFSIFVVVVKILVKFNDEGSVVVCKDEVVVDWLMRLDTYA